MLSNSSTSSVSDVVIAGTDGTFTNTSNANLNAGQQLTVSGTFGGTGAISGYADPTTYLVSTISGRAGAATAYLGDTSAATNFRLSMKNLNTVANASSAITAIDTAISQISSYQSAVGASQNIMTGETSLNNAMSTASTSAYRNLTNADMAKETAKLAVAQIQQSSASAMLAQANQMNKDMVITLLKQFIH